MMPYILLCTRRQTFPHIHVSSHNLTILCRVVFYGQDAGQQRSLCTYRAKLT